VVLSQEVVDVDLVADVEDSNLEEALTEEDLLGTADEVIRLTREGRWDMVDFVDDSRCDGIWKRCNGKSWHRLIIQAGEYCMYLPS